MQYFIKQRIVEDLMMIFLPLLKTKQKVIDAVAGLELAKNAEKSDKFCDVLDSPFWLEAVKTGDRVLGCIRLAVSRCRCWW